MPSCHEAAKSNMCYVVGDGLALLSTVTGLLTGDLTNPGFIPGRSKIFSSPPEFSAPTLGPTQLFSIKWVPGVFPELKWPGSESDTLIGTSI
jgi:hypothetical protein